MYINWPTAANWALNTKADYEETSFLGRVYVQKNSATSLHAAMIAKCSNAQQNDNNLLTNYIMCSNSCDKFSLLTHTRWPKFEIWQDFQLQKLYVQNCHRCALRPENKNCHLKAFFKNLFVFNPLKCSRKKIQFRWKTRHWKIYNFQY